MSDRNQVIYPPKLLADVIDFLESTPSAVTKHVSTGILICKTEPDFIMCLYYSDADNEFSFFSYNWWKPKEERGRIC